MIEVEPTYFFIIDRLLECGCDIPDPWGVGFSIDMIDSGSSIEPYSIIKDSWNAERHASRIRYLINCEFELRDPIEVESIADGTFFTDTICIYDGWHRFFAHIYLNEKFIKATFGGLISIREYLTGEKISIGG